MLSTWEIAHELPGRIRFRNRLIRGQPGLCAAIDRALTRTPGVPPLTTNARTATVLILHEIDEERPATSSCGSWIARS